MAGWGVVAALLIAAAPGERTMSVVYERTGGFAGQNTRLEIADGKTLKLKDRRAGEFSRPLTAHEQQSLKAHLEKVRKAPLAPSRAPRSSDSFHHKLTLDGQQRVDVATTGQTPTQDGSAESELLGFLDALATAELKKHDGQRQEVLNPDETLK